MRYVVAGLRFGVTAGVAIVVATFITSSVSAFVKALAVVAKGASNEKKTTDRVRNTDDDLK